MQYTVSVSPAVRHLRAVNDAFTVTARGFSLLAFILTFAVSVFVMSLPWLIALVVSLLVVSGALGTVRRRVLDRTARTFVFLALTTHWIVVLLGATVSGTGLLLTEGTRLPEWSLPLITTVGTGLLVGAALVGLASTVGTAFLSDGARALRAIRDRHEQLTDPRVHADVLGGRPAPPLRSVALHQGGRLVLARSRAIGSVLAAIAVGYGLNYSLFALGVPVPMSLLLSLAPFNIVLVKAVNHWRLSAAEVRSLDPRDPVLILRAFADDTLLVGEPGMDFPMTFPPSDTFRLEQLLAHGLRSYGPSVTIGSPRERFPWAGAARQYESDASWRDAVRELIREAPCLVYVVAAGEHLAWELREGARHRGADAMLFVVPPVPDRERRRRWEEFKEFAEAALRLRMGEVGSRRGHVPLIVLTAGKDLVFLEGDDNSGRSYLVAARLATQLVAEPRAGVADLRTFLAEHLPDLRLEAR